MKNRIIQKIMRTLFLLLFAGAACDVSAQIKTVTGTVIDQSGEVLIGVSVKIVGTNSGVITDMNGNFILKVDEKASLSISYIGYKTQVVPVNKRTKLEIILKEDSKILDEVVVVGFGTMKKSNLTGAVDQLKTAKLMETRPVNNLAQGLQGQVAGLNITTTTSGGDPTGNMDINIRGYTGVGAADAPLILLDGIQISMADFKAINSQDVESISLLKDASSAAIYGMQAANGVLLITTKQGDREKPMSLSFRYQGKWNQLMNAPVGATSPQFVRLLNYADKSAGGSYSINQGYLDRIDMSIIDSDLYPTVVPDGNHPDQWIPVSNQYANTQWYNALLDKVVYSDQYNISVSGGGKTFDYYVSGGLTTTNGMYKYGKDSNKVFTFSPKFTLDLTSWLNFRFIGDYSRTLEDKPYIDDGDGGNWFHAIARQRPYAAAIDPNGVPINLAGKLERDGRVSARNDKHSYQGEFTIKPFKGMMIFLKGGYRGNINEGKTIKKSNTTYGPMGLVPSSGNNSRIQKVSQQIDFYTINPYFLYTFDLGEHTHNFGITGGLQYEETRTETITSAVEKLQTEFIPSLNLAYGKNSTFDKITNPKNAGYFGRVTYNYKERYLIEANYRYDGTSSYMRNKRWASFPSFSAGYLISNEPFFQPLTHIIPSLKFRGSWGVLSKPSEMNIWDLLEFFGPDKTAYYFTGKGEDGKQTYVTAPSKIVSRDVTWSRPTTIDFGFDITLFDRFTAVFDWYRRTIDKEIGPSKTYPNILGFTPPSTNNTKSSSTGVELTLTYFGKIGRDINYNLRGTFSDYTGEVNEYDNITGDLGEILTQYYAGKSQGEIWGFVTDKMAKTENDLVHAPNQSYFSNTAMKKGDIIYKDLNGDGIIDRGKSRLDDCGDLTVIGNTTPRYQYSFGGDIEWKGLFVSAFLQGVGKRDWMPAVPALKEPPIDNPVYFWGGGTGAYHHAFFSNHFTSIYRPEDTPEIEGGPNVNGWLPRIYSSGESLKNQQPQTGYIQNAAYLRIKNITIGYNFPRFILRKIRIHDLQISVTCDNVHTFHKMDVNFIDPELAVGNAKIYPMQRVYSIGANIKF